MQIPVLVEPVAGRGYVAMAGPPFGWSAEGATAEEAVDRLRAEVAKHSANGARLTTLEWPDAWVSPAANGSGGEPPGAHPLLKYVGTWDPNDPMIQEWMKAIEEYRRQIDNDPNVY